nr:outer membrane protein assembly factor BamB [uncultured Roseateles sp.]
MRAGKSPSVRLALSLGLAAALLGGCSIFSSSSKSKPTPLETLTPQIAGRVVWNQRLDSVKFPLAPAVVSGNFIVAGSDGTVTALAAATGQTVWRVQVGEAISAGVGSDGRFSAVVTRNNDLVVMDGERVLWRKPIGAPVSTPPLVAGERVFVQRVDRVVQAFDALDGRKVFDLRRPGEALTLAQAGVLASYKDTLVAGLGPRLTGLDPLNGNVRWEAAVANPRGTNEVERLSDVLGPVVRAGETICVRAFQSAVGCVNAERGTALWTRNVGGTDAIGGDAQAIYGADGSDRITAWKTATGDVIWTAEQFLHRDLSAPLVLGNTVLFGDFEGQVHFLARDTGKTQLRVATDGSAIVGRPVASGTTVLVVTRNGGLFALRPE